MVLGIYHLPLWDNITGVCALFETYFHNPVISESFYFFH